MKVVIAVQNETLSVQLLPSLWYNETTGLFEQLQREDGLSPLSQRESLNPSVYCIRSAVEFDVRAGEHNPGRYHDMVHVSLTLLYLKQVVYKNIIYTL